MLFGNCTRRVLSEDAQAVESPPKPRNQMVSMLSKPGVVAIAVGIVTFVIFLRAITCGFVNWDDNRYVYDNKQVLDGLSFDGLRYAARAVVVSNWAPLTILSYQVDATLWHGRPWGFHLTNILVHAMATGLFSLAFSRMTGSVTKSGIAALLFGIHPLRVESVVWIAERKDVLSLLFIVIALLAYESYCRAPSRQGMALVFAAMLGSLLAKPMAVTLPVLLLLLDIWPMDRLRGRDRSVPAASRYVRRTARGLVYEKSPLFALAVAVAAITVRTHAGSGALQGEDRMPLVAARIPHALYALNWYLWKTFWPSNLSPLYRNEGFDISPSVLLVYVLVLLLLSWAGWRCAVRHPYVPWGLAWYGVAIAPVLGVIQTGLQGQADRYTYLPHIGLLTMLVWLAADISRRLQIPVATRWAAMTIVAVACVATTVSRIGMWHDSGTLWSTVIRQDPANAMAHFKLANFCVETGQLGLAETHYQAALRQAGDDWPGYVCRITSLTNLARLYFQVGDREKCRAARDLAVSIAPNDPAVVQMLEQLDE